MERLRLIQAVIATLILAVVVVNLFTPAPGWLLLLAAAGVAAMVAIEIVIRQRLAKLQRQMEEQKLREWENRT